MREADELIAQQEGQRERFSEAVDGSNSALDSAREKRRVTDSLMDAVREANVTATEAVETANRMLIEAEETLASLRGEDLFMKLETDRKFIHNLSI